ncbi:MULTISPECIES: DUF1572 family protein [unclassified Bacillus (in: firmicutes)]|uniref:DUF1572 family protein n=1 Tax=unclassified Bacillus (in: firmicutes) TaxID=185979 RepID=UPI001BEAEF8E|nr:MULTISPECIES: DUF1572 family protein [unclassified Bacillus (in: firmicutes)]MBT2637886.1 DUF1572 family protein [Bacillus sp. ISL-39]MBT2661059.1 DUF1572 family protein [Bacillus sp. ISL-45]
MTYLNLATENFKNIKNQSERAMEQLNFQELHYSPNEESNSIAIIAKHMSGNLQSRFRDFLTADGEKPDRNRDGEFEGTFPTREALISHWNAGWTVLFQTLSQLSEEDLDKTVFIRNEPHTAIEAIQRQVVHQATHAGQIVFLAKIIKNEEWNTLSIPKGYSQQFNEKMMGNQNKEET